MDPTDKKKKSRFIGIPYTVASSDAFASLSAFEVKFLVDLLHQYTGSNNGKLSPTFSLMKKRGWAKGTLYRTFASLERKGFVVITRQGWKQKGRATLVAITWLGIHECGVEYDSKIVASDTPLAYWCKDPKFWGHSPTLKLVKNAA